MFHVQTSGGIQPGSRGEESPWIEYRHSLPDVLALPHGRSCGIPLVEEQQKNYLLIALIFWC